MLAGQQRQYLKGSAAVRQDDESDDEEVLASNFVEALQEEDDLESFDERSVIADPSRQDDLQERLQAAAQPLDFQAPLEARFASYDNYCSLFHFILNSDGPVELDTPAARDLVWLTYV